MWRNIKNRWYQAILASIIAGLAFPAMASMASTHVQAQICADFTGPTIASPTEGLHTKNDSIIVTGTGEPNSGVTVLRNSESVGAVVTGADGSFTLSVPLVAGQNSLVTRAVNACGTVKDSSAVTVWYDAPTPPAPSTPSATQQTQPPAKAPVSSLSRFFSVNSLKRPITVVPSTPGFMKPTITSLLDGATVHGDELTITGKAEPGSVVTIYVNGKSVAQVLASSDGTFRVQITLKAGSNTVQVRSTVNGKTATSNIMNVTYTPPASPKAKSTGSSPHTTQTIIMVTAAIVASIAAVGLAEWRVHKLKGGR